MGTSRASASLESVAMEGDTEADSILDNIPGLNPAISLNDCSVMSRAVRNSRMRLPKRCSAMVLKSMFLLPGWILCDRRKTCQRMPHLTRLSPRLPDCSRSIHQESPVHIQNFARDER